MNPSCAQDGQCMCVPPLAGTISRRFVPSASATQIAPPAVAPARMNVMRVPSGDHRTATNDGSRSARGAPANGAGISYVAKAVVLPRTRAATAMRLPSGDTSRPPTAADPDMSRPDVAVRFVGSPPARDFTQTFGEPPASDRYATHLPSGETTGPNSRAGPAVIGIIRENVGAFDVFGCRLADHHPHDVAASTSSDAAATAHGSSGPA